MSYEGIDFGEARDLAQNPTEAVAYALVLLERLCEAVEALTPGDTKCDHHHGWVETSTGTPVCVNCAAALTPGGTDE